MTMLGSRGDDRADPVEPVLAPHPTGRAAAETTGEGVGTTDPQSARNDLGKSSWRRFGALLGRRPDEAGEPFYLPPPDPAMEPSRTSRPAADGGPTQRPRPRPQQPPQQPPQQAALAAPPPVRRPRPAPRPRLPGVGAAAPPVPVAPPIAPAPVGPVPVAPSITPAPVAPVPAVDRNAETADGSARSRASSAWVWPSRAVVARTAAFVVLASAAAVLLRDHRPWLVLAVVFSAIAATLSLRQLVRFLVVGVVIGAASIALRVFVVQPYYIPSESMEPTLHGCAGCNNDHVLVDKLSYKLHDVHAGDIVVFARPPGDASPDKVLIKRVVGLAGDTVALRSGLVYVNGLRITESYVNKACGPRPTQPLTSVSRWRVPKDDVFVLGDNRCNSHDSRAFGPIAVHSIVGRAFVTIWPVHRIGLL